MLEIFSDTRAIIFDMDGVLFLSSGCHERAFQETLSGIGIVGFSYASIAGMRTDDAMRKVLAENGRGDVDDSELDALVEDKRGRARGLLAEEGVVADGAAELVAHLHGKYRLALASSASPRSVELFLKRSGFSETLEFSLDGSMVPNAKPAPDIYDLAVRKLGLKPGQCVVIEDAVNGVQAAVAANIPVIAIAPERHRDAFARFKPVMIISDLSDIGPLFDPLYVPK
jgi:HAD superfamily hydrolase (TIGR01509 family)